MNKAEKRLLEAQTTAQIYTYTQNQIDWEKDRLKWDRESKADFLKDNPEADAEYYDNEIEKHIVVIEKLEKITELLLKQMQRRGEH